MKCDVCGSKKTELLTSWACDTCDFGSRTPVADHILGFDKGTDVQRLRQQEAADLRCANLRGGGPANDKPSYTPGKDEAYFKVDPSHTLKEIPLANDKPLYAPGHLAKDVLRVGPDRSLWDDLNKEYSGAGGLANDKPLHNPDRSLWDTCKDEDISEAASNAMARYALGLGEPAPARHWDILPSKIPAGPGWFEAACDYYNEQKDSPGRHIAVRAELEYSLSDDVAELVDAASLLWDTAGEACEFIDDLAMKHQLLDDVRALRLALDRILYKETE